MTNKTIGIKDILLSQTSWKVKSIKLADYILGSLLCFCIFPRPRSSVSLKDIHRILIIRPGGIGDAVFLSPLLTVFKQKYPKIKIHILCEKRNKEMFLLQSFSQEDIYCYDQLSSFFSLFKNRYEVIIDTEQWHYSTGIVALLLKAPYTIGFSTRPLRTKLFHKTVPYSLNAYEKENFHRLFTAIDDAWPPIKNINVQLKIPEYDELWCSDQLSNVYIALHIGASIEARKLKAEQWIKVIQKFDKKPYALILLGNRKDKHLNDRIMRQIKSPRLHSFVGKTSLTQTSAIINKCKIFIGSDSGILHLACALSVPVIAVFGAGNQEKWAPRGTHDKIISADTSCSPCTLFGYTLPTCQKQYFCTQEIDLDKIIEAIEQNLKLQA